MNLIYPRLRRYELLHKLTSLINKKKKLDYFLTSINFKGFGKENLMNKVMKIFMRTKEKKTTEK